MKKIISVLLLALVVLTGCSSDKVENSLKEKVGAADQIESVIFIQGQGINGFGSGFNTKDNAGDMESVLDVFSRVSSDGEPFEEYKAEGFYKLYYPSIKVNYSSGDSVVIEWEIGKGILIYNDTEYYINKEQGKKLYDIFTKYCPYSTGLQ